MKKNVVIASVAIVLAISISLLVPNLASVNAAVTIRPTTEAQSIIVKVNSPFGEDIITSFLTINTSNMLDKSGYYTIKLTGPIYNSNWALLEWIANDKNSLSTGQVASAKAGPSAATMGKGDDIGKPLKGSVTIQMNNGMEPWETSPIRELKYRGCHIASYYIDTFFDDEKPLIVTGSSQPLQHTETVVFACKELSEISAESMGNGRVESEKAPISRNNALVTNNSRELEVNIESDKNRYSSDVVFTVTVTDSEGNRVDPDKLTAYYDGRIVSLDNVDTGEYTFTASYPSNVRHQLIVIAEKGDLREMANLVVP